MDVSLVLRKVAPGGLTERLFRCVKAIDFDETADRLGSGSQKRDGEVVEVRIQTIPEEGRAKGTVRLGLEAGKRFDQILYGYSEHVTQPQQMAALEIGPFLLKPQGDGLPGEPDAASELRLGQAPGLEERGKGSRMHIVDRTDDNSLF